MKNVNLRLDDELHAQVKAAAGADERSLNGELSWLLRAGLKARNTTASAGDPGSGPAEGPNSTVASAKR